MGDGQESNQDCMCNIFNPTSAKWGSYQFYNYEFIFK